MGSTLQSQDDKNQDAKNQDQQRRAASCSSPSLRAGCAKLLRRDLPPAVMAIINVTPDSFSGDGLLSSVHKTKGSLKGRPKERHDDATRLLRAAERALLAGADWLDVGAQSTRPGATALSVEQERARLLPSLEALLRAFPEALLSVDTDKAELALESLRLGAHMLNDVSGVERPALWRELGKTGDEERGWVVLMHHAASRLHRGLKHEGGGSWQPKEESESAFLSVLARLEALAEACVRAGVRREKIVLDPGLGFGKTLAQNLTILRSWAALDALAFPTMLGASRKSFLGALLARGDEGGYSSSSSSSNPAERLEGSLASVAAAMAGGVRILRVHDVAETVRFVRAFYPLSSSTSSLAVSSLASAGE